MGDLLRIKRGLKSDLPELMQGEFGFCTDTDELYIGGVNGNVGIGHKDDQIINAMYPPAPLQGIDPTGVIDSAPRMQAIIDSITSGVIRMPKGTYKWGSKVSVNKSNVAIIGDGIDRTFINFTGIGDALESNNGSWNGTTYTPGFGTSLGSIVWTGFTLDGSNATTSVGLRLARVARGSRVSNIKFRNLDNAMIINECWDNGIRECIFETNGLALEMDRENNNFVVFGCVFSDNDKHVNFPAVLGNCRKVSFIGCSFDAMGANGGCTFAGIQSLTLSDIYAEVYTSDPDKTKNFFTFENSLTGVNLDGILMISPSDSTYTGTWLKINGGNLISIDNVFNYQAGAKSLDIVGGQNIRLGNVRFEGTVEGLPAASLVMSSNSVRFPATTTTDEWKLPVCRVIKPLDIPRVSVIFDTDWTPDGQKIRVYRQDTGDIVLDTVISSGVLVPAFTAVDLGSINAISPGVVLTAYLYKVGSSIDSPAGTIIIDQV